MRLGINSPKYSGWNIGMAIASMALTILYLSFIPLKSTDLEYFLLPWFDIIKSNGFSAMAADFSNYSPPYIYLLGLISLLTPFASPIILIKSLSIIFTFFSAVIFGLIVSEITGKKNYSLASALLFPLIPSIAMNATWWGQCDIIYTSFLLCSFLCSLRHRPLLVAIFFSISFSFKAQAVFFIPYIFFLLIEKEISWKYAVILPIVYALFMFPAWAAGRGALDLILIYANQGNTYNSLSMGAPNPWALIKRFPMVSYNVGILIGIVATIFASFAIAVKSRQLSQTLNEKKALVACASVLLTPYLLPKMHERYFFPADVFIILLAAVMPSMRSAAISLQIASIVVSIGFLFHVTAYPNISSLIGLVFSSFSVVKIMQLIFSARSKADVE